MEELLNIINEIDFAKLTKLIAHDPTTKAKCDKFYCKLISLKNELFIQIEYRTGNSVSHLNVPIFEFKNKLIEEIIGNFKKILIETHFFKYDILISKKNKITLSKRSLNFEPCAIQSHNRDKDYLLKENVIIPPMIDLGIMTADGKIIQSKYDKFKQINRFIELVDDVVVELNKPKLRILDFGCGKSYLTFIVYYYLQQKNIDVEIIGLDLKEDVIQKCNLIAKKYNYNELKFEVGDINGYNTNAPIDIVITLHACDTATDYAMFNAIKWGVNAILSVPCCQHELNGQISSDKLSIICEYGIIKERVSALFTDAIRAKLLEYMGYKTQIIEFVDLSHSPKNLMIRAVKGNITQKNKCKALNDVQNLINEFNLKPTLYNLIMENIILK